MGKNLVNKLNRTRRKIWNGVRKGICGIVAAATLSFAGCTKECTPIPPNYPPVITSVPVTEVGELEPYTYDVNATDTEGDTLTYSLTVFPDWLSINSSTGLITGIAPGIYEDALFDIEVGVSDGVNPVVTQGYTLTVKNFVPPVGDYLDVEGYFQNLDTESAGSAIIKIFNKDSTIPIAQTQSDAFTGYFSFHSTTTKVSDLSGVVIEAAAKEDGIWKSFLVRENFPAGDVIMSKPLRAKFFPDYCTPSEFKTFMNQINMSTYGLTRFDLENANGIEILLKNCDPNKNWGTSGDENIGWQYSNDPSNLKNNLKNGIADFVGGEIVGDNLHVYANGQEKIIPIGIEDSPLSEDHYTIVGSMILPILGWVTFVPNKGTGGGETSFFWDFDGSRVLIKRARIDLGVVNSVGPMHEAGHAYIGQNMDYNGHCNILPFYHPPLTGTNTLTIMTPNNISLTTPGPADKDARKIIYNYFYSPGKSIKDTLGQTFSDGEAVY